MSACRKFRLVYMEKAAAERGFSLDEAAQEDLWQKAKR